MATDWGNDDLVITAPQESWGEGDAVAGEWGAEDEAVPKSSYLRNLGSTAAKSAVTATGQAVGGIYRLADQLAALPQRIGIGAARTVGAIPQSEADLLNQLTDQGVRLAPAAANVRGASELAQISAGNIRSLADYYEPDPARAGEFSTQVAQAAGGLAPVLVSPTTALPVLAGQFGEAERERAIAEGDSPEVADAKFTLGALGGGVLGAVPPLRVGGRPLVSAIGKVVGGAGINVAQDVAVQKLIEPNAPLDMDRVKFNAIFGALFGGAHAVPDVVMAVREVSPRIAAKLGGAKTPAEASKMLREEAAKAAQAEAAILNDAAKAIDDKASGIYDFPDTGGIETPVDRLLKSRERAAQLAQARFEEAVQSLQQQLKRNQIGDAENIILEGTPAENQLLALDTKFGEGQGAVKERARLAQIISEERGIPIPETPREAQVAARLQGKTLEQQKQIIDQEIKLGKGTDPQSTQRKGLELKQNIETALDAQKLADEQAKAQVDAAKAQQKAIADQQKAVQQAQAEAAKPAEVPKSTQILQEQAKPPVLANVAAETASMTQGSPFALQGALNNLTAPKVETPAPVNIGPRDASVSTGTGKPTAKEQQILAEQKRLIEEYQKQQGGQPNAIPEQIPNAGVLRPEGQEPKLNVELQGVGEGNAQAQRTAGDQVRQGAVQESLKVRESLAKLSDQKLSDLADQLGISTMDMTGDRLRTRIEINATPERIQSAINNPAPPPTKGKIAGSKLEKWADKVIKDSQKRVRSGLDPEELTAHTVKLVAQLERGAIDFATWSAEKIKEAGELIRPYLTEIWDRAQRQINSTMDGADRVGRRLGVIEDLPTIPQDISNTRLKLDRFLSRLKRGTPMRKPFFDAAERTKAAINAAEDEAKILLADARAKINATTKRGAERDALEAKLNEVFQDITKVNELPENLRATANRLFKIREENATKLAAMESLTDATRNTIAETGGNYLARNYAIFRLRDPLESRAYRESLPKQDVEAALDAIQELWAPPARSPGQRKLAESTIDLAANNPENAVAVIKSLRPWMTDTDAAVVAAWVRAGKQPGNVRARALYHELINPSEITRAEASVLLDEFLDRDKFLGFSVGRRNIGGKDVTSLYQKKNIDPRLRKVLGEIKDPLDNAYQSIRNQVNLIERDKQQREFIRIGEAMGIMTRDPDVAAAKGMRPFLDSADSPNSPYDNWAGVSIYPWLKDEFAGAVQSGVQNPRLIDNIIGAVKGATALFKWLKLIPAPDSRSVNLIGAWWNNATNARAFNPVSGNVRDGLKAVLLSNGLISPKGDLNTQRLLDLRKVLVRNRVLDESVLGRDFTENIKKSLASDFFGKVDDFLQHEIDNPGLRKAYMGARFFGSGKEFAAGDDIMRVAGFLAERDRYRKAFPNLPDAAVDELAGRVMNQTGMTYSEVPTVLKEASQLGITDAFTSFPYSVYRSTANTARLGYAELMDGLRTGNHELAKIGSTRLAALATGAVAASGLGISKLINDEHGVTPEQEEAAKVFAPEYVKDSPLAFDAPIENGKATFVQMNYLLPSSLYMSAIEEGVRVAREEGALEGAGAAAGRVASQFTGLLDEERPALAPIPTTIGKVLGLINEDSFGRPIYNPQDPQKWKRIADSVSHDWAPGFKAKLDRLVKANNPDTQATDSGRVYSNEEEFKRLLGRRATTVNAKQLLPSKAYQYYEAYQNAARLYPEAVRRERLDEAGTPERQIEFTEGERIVQDRFNDLVRLRDAALLMDLDESEIRAGMLRSGMPKKLVNQVMAGQYVPPVMEMQDAKLSIQQAKREQYRGMGAEPSSRQKGPTVIEQFRALRTPDEKRTFLREQYRQGNITIDELKALAGQK